VREKGKQSPRKKTLPVRTVIPKYAWNVIDITFSQCSSISHALVLSLEFTCTRIDCNVMVVFSVLEQAINEGSVAKLKGQHTEAISKAINM
jgi:hypothetical protein